MVKVSIQGFVSYCDIPMRKILDYGFSCFPLFFLILLFFGVIHCVLLSKGLIFLTSLSPGSLFTSFFFGPELATGESGRWWDLYLRKV